MGITCAIFMQYILRRLELTVERIILCTLGDKAFAFVPSAVSIVELYPSAILPAAKDNPNTAAITDESPRSAYPFFTTNPPSSEKSTFRLLIHLDCMKTE